MKQIFVSTTSFKSENLVEVLAVFARLGWRQLDVNLHPFRTDINQARSLSQYLRDEGFQIGFASGGWCDFFLKGDAWKETEDSVQRQLEILDLLGTKSIRLFLGRLHAEDFDESALENVTTHIHSLASRYPSVRFSFENHDGASLVPANVIRIIRKVDLPNVGVTIDPINYFKAGANPFEALALDKSQIFHVHAKGLTEDKHYCEYGAGCFDYPSFLLALRRIGYSGDFTLEYEGEHNPLVKLFSSFNQLKHDVESL